MKLMVGGAVSTEKLILFFKDDTTAHCLYYSQLILPLWASLVAQMVKNPFAMQET